MNMTRKALYFGDHGLIAQQIRHFKFGVTRLTRAQQFTRAADLQIFCAMTKPSLLSRNTCKRICAVFDSGAL